MNTAENAFTLTTDISEDILIDLTATIDALDDLHMMINGEIAAPEEDRDLTDYITRATLYLEFLRATVEEGDILTISTIPMTESVTRRRISRLLRSSTQRERS